MQSWYAEKPWLAHYRVPRELPVPSATVLDAFEERARRSPHAPALHYFDESLSFAAVDELAERFAALLSRWDVGKGDRIALSLQNNPQFAIAQFGAWKRGVIVVPLNPMLKRKEVEYQLRDASPRVWVGLESLYAADVGEALATAAVEHVVTTHEFDLLSGEPRVKASDTTDFLDALRGQAPDPNARAPVGGEDLAYLVYTSGTTGPAKGAISLHRNIAFNSDVLRSWLELGSGDCILGLAPLFHITGLVAQLAVSAWSGAPLILFHRFDPAEALRLACRWQPTLSVAAITAYIALMNHPDASQARPFVPKCYSGGAPVAPSLTEQFETRFGSYIHNAYGLTETNSPSHLVPLGVRAPIDSASGALSIGIPVPNCDATILDLDDPDQEVPLGQAGELAVKGPMVFPGYWNKPEESARAFHNGWFRTGDVAIMDAAGWFYLVDRKKDMIIASGFKVWPREVEDVLYQHPAVREAAVVGIPDAYRGETVKAFVALRKDYPRAVEPEEIVGFCRERLAAYKYPRQVEVVAEIPKTATGKFLRRELRQM